MTKLERLKQIMEQIQITEERIDDTQHADQIVLSAGHGRTHALPETITDHILPIIQADYEVRMEKLLSELEKLAAEIVDDGAEGEW